MGLFDLFSGRSPEFHEQRGDECTAGRDYGNALLEYEKALEKIDRRFPEKVHLKDRLNGKRKKSADSLAGQHLETAEAVADSGVFEEAREYCRLAMDLAQDEKLKKEIENKLGAFSQALASLPEDPEYGPSGAPDWRDEEAVEDEEAEELGEWIEEAAENPEYDEEIFGVLCSTLPEDLREAYQEYGESFAVGYVALNEGDFEAAAEYLEDALSENSTPNLIPLELATAYIHLGLHEEASGLLDSFVRENPEQPRAYQLLCEIYWENRAFGRADRLLEGVPESIRETKAILLLKGENRFQQKDYAGAQSIFEHCSALYPKDEIVMRALAKTSEASGAFAEAKQLYAEVINRCLSCGTRTDPFLKRRYAELCFKDGETSSTLLNLYLSLAQDDPDNRPLYFNRISSIFQSKGEHDEAKRYKKLEQASGTV